MAADIPVIKWGTVVYLKGMSQKSSDSYNYNATAIAEWFELEACMLDATKEEQRKSYVPSTNTRVDRQQRTSRSMRPPSPENLQYARKKSMSNSKSCDG